MTSLLRQYSVYEPQTGRIRFLLTCDEKDVIANVLEDCEIIEGHYPDDKYYIVDNKPIEKPHMKLEVDKDEISANREDTVTISNVPAGCKVFCRKLPRGQRFFTVDDGELIITTEVEGEYTFKFECWPYLDEEVTINAT